MDTKTPPGTSRVADITEQVVRRPEDIARITEFMIDRLSPVRQAAGAKASRADDCGCAVGPFALVGTPREYTVVVGGAEYTAGGWDEYVLAGREERRKYARDPQSAARDYPDRTYVTAEDVVDSVAQIRQQTGRCPLTRSLRLLRLMMLKRERQIRDGTYAAVTLPPMRASDLAEDAGGHPEELPQLREDVGLLGEQFGVEPLPLAKRLPALPKRTVVIGNREGIAKLEAATVPYLRAAERMRAEMANYVAAVAEALNSHRIRSSL